MCVSVPFSVWTYLESEADCCCCCCRCDEQGKICHFEVKTKMTFFWNHSYAPHLSVSVCLYICLSIYLSVPFCTHSTDMWDTVTEPDSEPQLCTSWVLTRVVAGGDAAFERGVRIVQRNEWASSNQNEASNAASEGSKGAALSNNNNNFMTWFWWLQWKASKVTSSYQSLYAKVSHEFA